MAIPTPNPGQRGTRISNPIEKTVLTFPQSDPIDSIPSMSVLRRGTIGRTVLTFASDVALCITIRTSSESDQSTLSLNTAQLIRTISHFEESLGGAGLEFDPEGSRELSNSFALRLVARNPVGAEDRLSAVAAELNAAKDRALASVAEQQESLFAEIASRLRSASDMNRIRALRDMSSVEVLVG